jgi:hypothetical protein
MGNSESDWPTEAELKSQYTRQLRRPAHQPPVRNILMGSDSMIWLERPSRGANALWEVYDLDGKLIATARVDRRLQPLAVSRRALYGKEIDANGVESIVRYRAQ